MNQVLAKSAAASLAAISGESFAKLAASAFLPRWQADLGGTQGIMGALAATDFGIAQIPGLADQLDGMKGILEAVVQRFPASEITAELMAGIEHGIPQTNPALREPGKPRATKLSIEEYAAWLTFVTCLVVFFSWIFMVEHNAQFSRFASERGISVIDVGAASYWAWKKFLSSRN